MTRLIKLPPFRSRALLSGSTRRITGKVGLAAALAAFTVVGIRLFLRRAID